MAEQKTNETTLQFVAAFLKSQKGKYDETQIHLDKVLHSPDHQNDELVWFFKARMFQKMGKLLHRWLDDNLWSNTYDKKTTPAIEFVTN